MNGADPDSSDAVAAAADQVARGEPPIEVPDDLLIETDPPRPAQPAAEKPLWLQIREMTLVQRVKVALRGNREARLILIRDTNKLVRRLVLQNPRITEDELVMLARDRNCDEEMLRTIAENRDWTKSYLVRAALVENARTPLAEALRLLVTLGDREIARLAKSKNVPSAIANQARRIRFQKVAR